MLRLLLIIVVLHFWALSPLAQTRAGDSPREWLLLLQKNKPDTNRIKLLLQLGKHHLFKRGEHKNDRIPWENDEIKSSAATKGFHSITLTLKNIKATAEILTEVFGYKLSDQEGNHDLLEAPEERAGYVAGGTNHHVAFRVKNEGEQMAYS
jgi:hypothetical protein